MKVLLLGASGLLGHNVTQQLLHENHEVVAVVRNKGSMQIQESNLHVIEGNLTLDTLSKVAQGCDSIINCAGTTSMSLLHKKDYMPINRDLCNLIVTIMHRQHIQRLVHISTANTIGYGTHENPTNEYNEMKYPFNQSWYALSKQEGEFIIQQAAKDNPHWHMIIVNPGFMIGPYDTKPSSGKLLLAGYHKPLMITPKGGKSFVHVQDVAKAIVNGITMGQSGKRYLLIGESMSLKDIYQLQSKVMNYKQYIIEIPNWIIRCIGLLGDAIRFLHIKTQIATRNTNQLLINEYYSNEKAIAELKMPQTSIKKAITDFYSWQFNKNIKLQRI